ncbi:MAG: hypothetical protein JOZ51_21840 [Chloroflexi bacterium]|nr:hypothetical protein [Chloroflexota bacterium]
MQPPVDRAELRRQLAHVRWIGGAPCAGKSSIVTLLAERYELAVYRCDEHFAAHTQRVEPSRQPTLHQISAMSWDEIWMQPVATQVENQFRLYREEFSMIVEDLLALPRSQPLLAEGTALLPECVAALLEQPDRAMWIVPTATFQQTHYRERGAWVQDVLNQCVDPDEAWRRWMERDLRFAHTIAQDAATRGLSVLWTDGSRSIAASAALVAAQLRIDTGTPSRVAQRSS